MKPDILVDGANASVTASPIRSSGRSKRDYSPLGRLASGPGCYASSATFEMTLDGLEAFLGAQRVVRAESLVFEF
jgi:hypothetical protein